MCMDALPNLEQSRWSFDMTVENDEIKDNEATVSDDMKMTPEQIRIRKHALVQRLFAVAEILTQDGLETRAQDYLSCVLAAAKLHAFAAGNTLIGFLADKEFVLFVESVASAMKMLFFEPLTGETRDYAWAEIKAIENELKHITER